MANTTETVFVEFVVQDQQLESATESLQRTGQIDKKAADQFKATNTELARRQKIIDSLSKELKTVQDQNAKTIADLEHKLSDFIEGMVEGIHTGLIDGLKEAGFEFDEFGKIINKNTDKAIKKTGSLKGELRAMREELGQLALDGKKGTDEYDALARKIGEVEDALGDAAKAGHNFASDTKNIDGLISIGQGIAGAFAVAEGTIGAFTDDSEQLQQVMLKVNSALAILQGLQTVANTLQKESAAATLLNTVAQQAYNVVVGESIGLMRVFRIALAATGIGAVVLGLTFLVEWLTRTSKATKQLTQDFLKFNAEFERDQKNLNDAVAEGTRTLNENQARAKARGAQQSELAKAEIDDLQSTFKAVFDLEQQQRARANTAKETLTKMATGERAFNEDLANEAQKTVDNFNATKDKRLEIANEIRIKSIENEKQIQTEQLQAVADGLEGRLALARKNSAEEFQLQRESARANAQVQLAEAGDNVQKRLLIERTLQAQIRAINKEQSILRQQDRVSAAETELARVQAASRDVSERGNQEEVDAQKKVIQEKARLDLLAVGLTEQQKTSIRAAALQQQLQLQKDFNKQSSIDAINDQISLNNAQLAQVNLTNDERLHLTEDNILLAAQLEIDAAKGQADKIKAIRAKTDEEIRAARLASINKSLEDELALTQANNGVIRRANERVVADQRKSLSARIQAVNQLASIEIVAIDKQDQALKKSLKDQLISQEEYNVKHAQLIDKELEVVENAEIKKRELQKETLQKQLDFTFQTASQVLQLISDFGQQQTDREQARIDEQRAQVDALKDAGAITEKEAEARQKRLDQQENALKRKQAQRDKAIALFQAIINAASATVKALAEGGPVFAAIVAAIGAAQVALIASKPIPKFAKGKKDKYQGFGEIGEAGAELWQHDGNMYLAKSKSVVWIGAQDKVFNPKETVSMLDNMKPYIVKDIETNKYNNVTQQMNIDYDKLGAAVGKHIPQFGLNIDEDGLRRWTKYGNSFEKYLDNRRGFK